MLQLRRFIQQAVGLTKLQLNLGVGFGKADNRERPDRRLALRPTRN
jgi:hypothetical protein